MIINFLIADLSCIHCKQLLSRFLPEELLTHALKCTQVVRPDHFYKYVCYACNFHSISRRDTRHHIRSHRLNVNTLYKRQNVLSGWLTKNFEKMSPMYFLWESFIRL
uniref:Uncharacterized protein n=1 Tax=Cacopsylla melanoneura TaxID=428564 RepID=A0A8D8YX20_9HEMI